MIRNRIVKVVLVFYREALKYKAFYCFRGQDKCSYQNYMLSFYRFFRDLNRIFLHIKITLTLN